MQDAIKVEGLQKSYGDFCLGPISLQVPTGTVVGLVGCNGAGKTTLIKCLFGMTTPDAGSIRVLGEPVEFPQGIAIPLKQRIGVVFDTCAFPQDSKVADIGRLGKAVYSNWDAAAFDGYLRTFQVAPDKQVKKLSRGMGMKLSMAFALGHHPDLLILDEATAGLDPLARDDMLDILREFMANEGHSILMATHITSDLERFADIVVCIDDGKLAFTATKEAICNEAGIAHCNAELVERIAAMAADAGNAADANVDANADGFDPFTGLRVIKHEYGTDVLVPDRFAFAREFPEVPVEPASIDDYLTLTLKGEKL